jgi:hypothetical protein
MASPGRETPVEQRPLAETVAALSKEVRDLRASARMRAVIEQAKGVLVERHGITLDEAFARLRTMSQEHNVRLVEVAATVVGVAIPDIEEIALADAVINQELPLSKAASGTWRALREQPEIKAGVVSAIMDSLAGSTRQGDEAAQLLLDMLQGQDVAALTIYRAGLDGSLRLVGQVGIPGDLVSSWRHIPPTTDIPYMRSLLQNRPYFFGSRDERVAEFPASAAARGGFRASATVPVVDEGEVIGVVGLVWNEDETFDEVRRKAISRTVQRITSLLLRNISAADPELEWLNTLLRLHLDPWVLMEAVITAEGQVPDFVVQDAATTSRSPEWIGRRFLEVWPDMAGSLVFDALRTLVQTGGSWTTTVVESSAAPWGVVGTQIRAVRLGQRLAVVWRLSESPSRTNSTVELPGV